MLACGLERRAAGCNSNREARRSIEVARCPVLRSGGRGETRRVRRPRAEGREAKDHNRRESHAETSKAIRFGGATKKKRFKKSSLTRRIIWKNTRG